MGKPFSPMVCKGSNPQAETNVLINLYQQSAKNDGYIKLIKAI